MITKIDVDSYSSLDLITASLLAVLKRLLALIRTGCVRISCCKVRFTRTVSEIELKSTSHFLHQPTFCPRSDSSSEADSSCCLSDLKEGL